MKALESSAASIIFIVRLSTTNPSIMASNAATTGMIPRTDLMSGLMFSRADINNIIAVMIPAREIKALVRVLESMNFMTPHRLIKPSINRFIDADTAIKLNNARGFIFMSDILFKNIENAVMIKAKAINPFVNVLSSKYPNMTSDFVSDAIASATTYRTAKSILTFPSLLTAAINPTSPAIIATSDMREKSNLEGSMELIANKDIDSIATAAERVIKTVVPSAIFLGSIVLEILEKAKTPNTNIPIMPARPRNPFPISARDNFDIATIPATNIPIAAAIIKTPFANS